jgi:hypothetical protein
MLTRGQELIARQTYARLLERWKDNLIWNHYKQFGSPYSPYNACNELAADPPVIVDQDGTAYLRVTLNRNSPKIGAGAQFYEWLASTVCHS